MPNIRDAIKNDDIRRETKAILHNEMAALQKSHDHMKALKTSMHAA